MNTPRLRTMVRLPLLALVASVISCNFDKLFTGGATGPPLSHGRPTGLTFRPGPGPAQAGQPLGPIGVAVVDSAGTPVAGADSLITITLNNNPVATLSGTATAHAVNGMATFRDLRIDKPAQGYTLTASGAGLPSKNSDPFDVMPPPPTTGDLTVITSTTGASPDPDGYSVTVDDATSQSIATNSTSGVSFTGLTPGSHKVELTGVAANCTVTAPNPRTVSVTAGGPNATTFAIACVALPPTTGSLAVTTTTAGASPDPDGYTVTVDGGGGASRPIQINQTITFNDLVPGSHGVVLSGIAGNCTVSGGTSQSVNITAGALSTASFSVDCPTPPPPPNQAPSVNAGTDPQIVLVSALFSLEGASFSDPDNGPWIVTIQWGDGSQDTFPMSSGGTVNRTHSYPVTLLGQDYQLRLTVEDARGAQGSATKTVSVKLL